MKVIKKQIVVDAVPYEQGLEDGFDYGMIDEYGFMDLAEDDIAGYYVPYIETLEGKHYILSTDWIITGVEGERYPIKERIFRKSYEPYTKVMELIN